MGVILLIVRLFELVTLNNILEMLIRLKIFRIKVCFCVTMMLYLQLLLTHHVSFG